MNFFTTLKDSIYSPEFYQNLGAKSLKSSIGYFFLLSLLLGVVASAVFAPAVFSIFSAKTVNETVALYPSDLEVVIANGEVSINQPEPYLVPVPAGEAQEEADFRNLVVFDTQTEFTPAQLTDYSTYVLVKKDLIAVKEKEGEIRLYPLADFGDELTGSINKAEIQKFADMIYSLLIPLAVGVVFLMVIVLTLGAFANLIYFFIAAVLVLAVGKLLKKGWTYSRSYQIALHASTVPMIISAGTLMFMAHMPPFSFSILLLLFVILNSQKKNLPAVIPGAPVA